ncbi:MAG: hypothetical protein BZY82_07205 [SAR202 cluster bacterium Io17-Chloro-G3]|nr:MAG: hypothetical protein BZY82_07205 [SAR202 cluster bacterium Io17-Chloro-G3]
MQATEIRQKFLDFFQGKAHLLVPSSSLIPPPDDPTLLLTSAGMVQFKPYFLGQSIPPSTRLSTVQKCFRVSDVEEVGDETHLTFFEMLGNFSIGDYFKEEAIAWAWEFVTEHMNLPKERLWASVYLDDDVAHGLWVLTGIPPERIRRFGRADNYWGPAGDEGPCGPCSEIHYDFGGDCRLGKSADECGPNCECGRFLELWNLVFMQFYQDPDGTQTPLPKPSIDTGMGLERATVILQGVSSIYETDLYKPIIEKVVELAGKGYGSDKATDIAIRVVAEHTRSATFLIADGVVPGNEGRGYVLRRLIRRAIRFGHKIGLNSGDLGSSVNAPLGVLAHVAEVVIEVMGPIYHELATGREFVLRVLEQEEERFSAVMKRGIQDLEGFISATKRIKGPDYDELRRLIESNLPAVESDQLGNLQANAIRIVSKLHELNATGRAGSTIPESGEEWARTNITTTLRQLSLALDSLQFTEPTKENLTNEDEGKTSTYSETQDRFGDLKEVVDVIPGFLAFRLHDTYGFPIEVTTEVATEHGLAINMESFEQEMEAQRNRARAASGFGGDWETLRSYQELGVDATHFVGYETTVTQSQIVGLLIRGEQVSIASDEQPLVAVGQVVAGTRGVEVVLSETPLYAEGGGQVGDAGIIEGPDGTFFVEETNSPIPGLIVHKGYVSSGTVNVGDVVEATVDKERRQNAGRNHTATHLLHAALRAVLGTHVRQQGSLVTPDRLRFDFTHVSPVSVEEMQQVEELVNSQIRNNQEVLKWETTYRQAVADGALAFFGERYGDQVRVIEIRNQGWSVNHSDTIESKGATGDAFSMEVCGGTHVDRTGDIGYCHILGEGSIGAGLRRIEAVTGRAAEALMREQGHLLTTVARRLETSSQEMLAKIDSLLDEITRLRREGMERDRTTSLEVAQTLLEGTSQIGDVRIVSGVVEIASAESLRQIADWLRDKLGSGIVSLGAVVNERPMILVMATKDVVARGVHAGNTVYNAAKVMGGGGGGRPDMAQGGGRDASKLKKALSVAQETLTRQLIES